MGRKQHSGWVPIFVSTPCKCLSIGFNDYVNIKHVVTHYLSANAAFVLQFEVCMMTLRNIV